MVAYKGFLKRYAGTRGYTSNSSGVIADAKLSAARNGCLSLEDTIRKATGQPTKDMGADAHAKGCKDCKQRIRIERDFRKKHAGRRGPPRS